MADFHLAVSHLLRKEGGFAPSDNGAGAVNFGITKRFLALIGDHREPAALSVADATELYRQHFWEPNLCGRINDQAIAEMLFEACANMGPYQATAALQRALGLTGDALDGRMGPQTVATVNREAPRDGTLLSRFRANLFGHYQRLAEINPKLYADDLAGWKARLGL